MSASKEHELIVALVGRYIRQQGFELVAIESSFSWLYGPSFQLPPAITLHRPDILGVRRDPPYICIGEAKTRNDLHSQRTRRQLVDFSETKIQDTDVVCQTIVGIPQGCEQILNHLLSTLRIPADRIKILSFPVVLLGGKRP